MGTPDRPEGGLTLSIATLRRHESCELDDRIADLCRTLGRDVPEDEEIPLRVWWDLGTTSTPDLWRSLRYLGEPGKRIGVEAACLAARRVLRRTREQDRPVCLAAIEAAEGWLRGDVTREECWEAADAAARAVADAAHDTHVAAHAAFVAYATRAAPYSYAAARAVAAAYAAGAVAAAAEAAADARAAAAAAAYTYAARAARAAAHAAADYPKQRIDLYRIAFDAPPGEKP